MADIKRAVADIERFKPLFEGVVALCDAVNEMGDVARLVNESQLRLASIKAEVAKAADRQAAADADLAKALRMVEESKQAAERIRDLAEADGQFLIVAAKNRIIELERKSKESIAAEVAALVGRDSELSQALRAKAAELDAINASIAEARLEHADAASKLAETQAAIKSLLGKA